MRWLSELPWPGNVRELKNAVDSAAMMAPSETLGLEEFESTLAARRNAPAPTRSTPAPAGPDHIVVSGRASLAEVERLLIAEHLKHARTKAHAAQSLGIGLRTLYSKVKRYRLADGDG
jgi:DNA-binding NtrC family response regulator